MPDYSEIKYQHKMAFNHLVDLLLSNGYEVKPEFMFHDTRRWRIDLAITYPTKIAIEFEGGAGMGRHTRVGGFVKDMDKYNEVAKHGFYLLRFQPMSGKKEETRQKKIDKVLEYVLQICENMKQLEK